MKDSARIRCDETAAQIKDAMEAAGLTRKEFAEKMGKSSLFFNREIPLRTIQRELASLSDKIEHRGSSKTGKYKLRS